MQHCFFPPQVSTNMQACLPRTFHHPAIDPIKLFNTIAMRAAMVKSLFQNSQMNSLLQPRSSKARSRRTPPARSLQHTDSLSLTLPLCTHLTPYSRTMYGGNSVLPNTVHIYHGAHLPLCTVNKELTSHLYKDSQHTCKDSLSPVLQCTDDRL